MKRLDDIVAQIKKLEAELLLELQAKQDEYYYVIKDRKVQFEEETRRYHKTLATRLHVYLTRAPILHIVTTPVVWACLFPAILLDLFVSIYHSLCFRIYGIPLVRRSDYIVIDRHNLQYLNLVEKLNCIYCGYFNGLIGYVQEIAARTEQYWCPIKHARKLSSIHSRYQKFIEYGDSDHYQSRLTELRDDFDDLKQVGR